MKKKLFKMIATILTLFAAVFGLRLVLQSLNDREEVLLDSEEDKDFDEDVT